MNGLLHRIVYDEYDWLNIRNTKAYKNYLTYQNGGDVINKGLYLNWVKDQILERSLDGRHLIASAKCTSTQKIVSVYADMAFAKEVENRALDSELESNSLGGALDSELESNSLGGALDSELESNSLGGAVWRD